MSTDLLNRLNEITQRVRAGASQKRSTRGHDETLQGSLFAGAPSEQDQREFEQVTSLLGLPPAPRAVTQPGPQGTPDFFVAEFPDVAIKDDQITMEVPIYSLSTKEDLKIWKWTSSDGKKSVEVAPSVYGRATMHDKDILIFLASQIVEAINQGQQPGKTVRFIAYDYLVSTERGTRGGDYQALQAGLERLRGTTIKTNIKTGGVNQREKRMRGFGLIDHWQVIEKSPNDARMVAVEVTLSDWYFNAIQALEVFTIDKGYFSLRKPLARRLYEIARKHVGRQETWDIRLEALRDKCGSTQKLVRRFKADLQRIIDEDNLPQYRIATLPDGKVRFTSRDAAASGSAGIAAEAALSPGAITRETCTLDG